ncbi:hypothetical protein DK853_35925, partial [Klebsiella oxytoca]
MMFAAQGCTSQDSFDLQYIIRDEKNVAESESSDESRTYEPEQPQNDSTEESNVREVSELYYAYHQLDAERQKLYLEMLDALT